MRFPAHDHGYRWKPSPFNEADLKHSADDCNVGICEIAGVRTIPSIRNLMPLQSQPLPDCPGSHVFYAQEYPTHLQFMVDLPHGEREVNSQGGKGALRKNEVERFVREYIEIAVVGDESRAHSESLCFGNGSVQWIDIYAGSFGSEQREVNRHPSITSSEVEDRCAGEGLEFLGFGDAEADGSAPRITAPSYEVPEVFHGAESTAWFRVLNKAARRNSEERAGRTAS